jgi:hypothetical protein
MSNFPPKRNKLTSVLRRLWREAKEVQHPQEITLEHGLVIRVCADDPLELVLMRDLCTKPSLDEIKAVANAVHWVEFETREGIISKGQRAGTVYYHIKATQPLM